MTPADPLRPHPCADFFKIATICSSENRFLRRNLLGMVRAIAGLSACPWVVNLLPALKSQGIQCHLIFYLRGRDFLTYRVDLLTDLARCRGKTGGTKNK
jgi:hypothetical protein